MGRIQGLFLDVDGVLVGDKIGFNSPDPHPLVTRSLYEIRKKVKFIALCTNKGVFGVEKLVREARLDNYHVVDGGGLLINPLDNGILLIHSIPYESAEKLIWTFQKNNVYVEIYTPEGYFIQKGKRDDTTKIHTHVLQAEPGEIDLMSELNRLKVTKIMPIARDEDHMKEVIEMIEDLKLDISMNWGVHPIALPRQFGIITAAGVSKAKGLVDLVREYRIDLDSILGVSDGAGDWPFIKLCKYKAAIGNASPQLKELVTKAGGFVGPGVNENGILEIFRFFNLIDNKS